MMCGGLGEAQAADKDIQAIIEKVKGHAEDKVNRKFSEYVAISFKSQVVAGTNYFIKVKVAENDYVHLRVFKPLPCYGEEPEFNNVQHTKTLEDDLEYF